MLHPQHHQVLRPGRRLQTPARRPSSSTSTPTGVGSTDSPRYDGTGPAGRPGPRCAEGGSTLPALRGLRRWIDRETKLANPALKAEVAATNDPDLALAYEWSEAVNRTIGEVVRDVPPFPFVRESLEAMAGQADVMVVSATPGEALDREWQEHGLKRYVVSDRRAGAWAEERAPRAGHRGPLRPSRS